MQETQWLSIREMWFSMGPDRDVRHLQRFIQSKFQTKIPVDLLMTEINARNWNIQALEYDAQTARKIDAATQDTMVAELASARLKAFRDMTRRFKDFGETFDKVMIKAKATLEKNKDVSLQEARMFMETYLKVLQFTNEVEIPLMPDDDGIESGRIGDPADLARALLTAKKTGDMTIEDLVGMREQKRNG